MNGRGKQDPIAVDVTEVRRFAPTIHVAIRELLRRARELEGFFLNSDAAGMRTTAHELRELAATLGLDPPPEEDTT